MSDYDNPNSPVNRKWDGADKVTREEWLRKAGLPTSLYLQELDEIHTPYAERIVKAMGGEMQNDDGLAEARNAGISMSGDGLAVGQSRYGSRENGTHLDQPETKSDPYPREATPENAEHEWLQASDAARKEWLERADVSPSEGQGYFSMDWEALPDRVQRALAK